MSKLIRPIISISLTLSLICPPEMGQASASPLGAIRTHPSTLFTARYSLEALAPSERFFPGPGTNSPEPNALGMAGDISRKSRGFRTIQQEPEKKFLAQAKAFKTALDEGIRKRLPAGYEPREYYEDYLHTFIRGHLRRGTSGSSIATQSVKDVMRQKTGKRSRLLPSEKTIIRTVLTALEQSGVKIRALDARDPETEIVFALMEIEGIRMPPDATVTATRKTDLSAIGPLVQLGSLAAKAAQNIRSGKPKKGDFTLPEIADDMHRIVNAIPVAGIPALEYRPDLKGPLMQFIQQQLVLVDPAFSMPAQTTKQVKADAIGGLDHFCWIIHILPTLLTSNAGRAALTTIAEHRGVRIINVVELFATVLTTEMKINENTRFIWSNNWNATLGRNEWLINRPILDAINKHLHDLSAKFARVSDQRRLISLVNKVNSDFKSQQVLFKLRVSFKPIRRRGQTPNPPAGRGKELTSMALAGRNGARDLQTLPASSDDDNIPALTDNRLDQVLAGVDPQERRRLDVLAQQQEVSFALTPDPNGAFIKRQGNKIWINSSRPELSGELITTALIHDIEGHDWNFIATTLGQSAENIDSETYEVIALALAEFRNIPDDTVRVRHALRTYRAVLDKGILCSSILPRPAREVDNEDIEESALKVLKARRRYLSAARQPRSPRLSDAEMIERTATIIRSLYHSQENVLDIKDEFNPLRKQLQYLLAFLKRKHKENPGVLTFARDFWNMDKYLRQVYGIIEKGMAHTRKNPMTSSRMKTNLVYLHSFLETLERMQTYTRGMAAERLLPLFEGPEHENLQNTLARIAEYLGRAADILQSRLDLAAAIPPITAHALHELLDHLVRDRAGIVLQNHLAKPARVMGNRLALISAINNIVENALYFSQKAGSTEPVVINASAEGPYVRLDITDKGLGIDPDLLRYNPVTRRLRLFDLDMTRRPTGTGLGTTEAWYAIRDAGGTIEVQSRPGEGTTFIIRLPMALHEPPESSQPPIGELPQKLAIAA